MVIHHRPVIWNRHGSDGPNFGEVRGVCRQEPSRRIGVTVHGRAARRKLLRVLAHEVRHALQERLGLFPSYYRPSTLWGLGGDGARAAAPADHLPDLDEAHAAEIDCDAWADAFLTARGVEPPGHRDYLFSSTGAYALHARLARELPGVYPGLPGARPERFAARPADAGGA